VAGICQPQHWSSAVTSKLTLLSLDVFGADTSHEQIRLTNILALLNKADADIVTFQEASTWLLEGLLADTWVHKTYHLTEFGKSHHIPGGLLILSKTLIYGVSYYEQVHPGQTANDERGKLLLIQTKINESPITVATTTLDWRSADTRAGILDFIFSIVSPFRDVLLTGGFNFDSGSQPETAHIPSDYIDVWSNVYSNTTEKPGFTWNPVLNEYAYQSDTNSQPSRIDRVFLRSTEWMARTISLVGCSKTDLLCQKTSALTPYAFKKSPSRQLQSSYVSNHYGLLVEFSHFEPHCV
jgi:endonuclease/exonuclease/phosphatase family metal-dependent hydrolase